MAVPAAMPVIKPIAESIVAMAVELLRHTPPVVASKNMETAPTQMCVIPVGVAGPGLTVSVFDAEQPVGNVYMMFVVPDNTPKTMPDDEPIVAIAVLLLLHVPPVVASASDADTPTQIDDGPVMPAGSWFTVAGVVVVQPVPNEYVTVTVPVVTPARKPVAEPIVATLMLLLVQVPPVAGSPNAVVLPTHTRVVPVIVPGNVFTVIVATVKHPVGSV